MWTNEPFEGGFKTASSAGPLFVQPFVQATQANAISTTPDKGRIREEKQDL